MKPTYQAHFRIPADGRFHQFIGDLERVATHHLGAVWSNANPTGRWMHNWLPFRGKLTEHEMLFSSEEDALMVFLEMN